jgi:hypothetical protein
MVVMLPGQLECSCPARGICTHRGLVYEVLREELKASAAVAEAERRESAGQELARLRESSPPAFNDKPFSLYE